MKNIFKYKNKKAVLGELMTTFIATILIVIILLIFVLVSGAVKLFSGISSGVSIASEGKIGMGNIFPYMNSFKSLVEKRPILDLREIKIEPEKEVKK